MNDEELIEQLRSAALGSAARPTGTELDEPLGLRFEEGVTARILADHPARGHAPAERPADGAKVTRLRLGLAASAGALAAAAALALVVGSRTPRAGAAFLPPYTVSVAGGQESMRGAAQASGDVVAKADAPLAIELRPPSDVEGPIAVHVFAVRGAVITETHPEHRVAASGAVQLRGTARAIAGAEAGDATVVVAITRPGAIVDARVAAEGGSAPPGAALARIHIRIVE